MHATAHRYRDDPRYPAPGVYFEEAGPEDALLLRTGVPAFLGIAQPTDAETSRGMGRPFVPYRLTKWDHFAERIEAAPAGGFLGAAIRGFFQNGGDRCVVIAFSLDHADERGATEDQWQALVEKCLSRLEYVDNVDLVCAPDLPPDVDLKIRLQRMILEHCKAMGDRFAILDAFDGGETQVVVNQRQRLLPAEGALYHPWIRVSTVSRSTQVVPPCGHVAGVYARTDARVGVYKAPANEIVEGAVDVREHVTDNEQRILNHAGVNCIRVLPGRGIRVWGARTLSGREEWRYVNVRRLFITLKRWIALTCEDLVFEPNQPALWGLIRDRLYNYCYDLFQEGALKGATPDEAFYVKCDAETNPPGRRQQGEVTTEIGLAAVRPAEFVVVRITQSATGTAMESISPVDKSAGFFAPGNRYSALQKGD